MKTWMFAPLLAGMLALSPLAQADGYQYEWGEMGFDSGKLDFLSDPTYGYYSYWYLHFEVPGNAPESLLTINFTADGYTTSPPLVHLGVYTSINLGPPDIYSPYPNEDIKDLDTSANHGTDTVLLTPGSWFVVVEPTGNGWGAVQVTGVLTPVPEPETWALLGVGALGLLARRWRSRAGQLA